MLRINGKQKAIKDIRGEIKYGATPEDFASYFGVTEAVFMEELKERLGQIFHEYKRELMKNKSKKKRKPGREVEASDDAETMQTSPVEVQETSKSHEEELEEKVKVLAKQLAELQAEKVSVEQKLSYNDGAISHVCEELQKLAEQVRNYQDELEALKVQKNENLAKKEALLLKIETQENILAEAERELDSCREVKVICRSEGVQISKEGFEPSVKDVEQKYIELSQNGKFDDYAVKHVRAAAKIICAVELLELMELRYSVSYEENVAPVEKIFKAAFESAA